MPSQDITNTVTACPIEPRIRELEGAVTFARGAASTDTAGYTMDWSRSPDLLV